MPMLTTLRMRLPVYPFHWPPSGPGPQNAAILSSTAWTSGTTSSPSTRICFAPRSAQGDVQHGPILGDVDLLAAEHGLDALPQAALSGELDQAGGASRR